MAREVSRIRFGCGLPRPNGGPYRVFSATGKGAVAGPMCAPLPVLQLGTTKCLPRRGATFVLPKPEDDRIVRAVAFVSGERVADVRGHDVRRLTLRHLPHEHVPLRVELRTAAGRTIVSSRTYDACDPRPPR